MMSLFLNFPLVVIALLCMWGIFTKHFTDNLLERIGLSLSSFAAVIMVSADHKSPHGAVEGIFYWGIAIYFMGFASQILAGKHHAKRD